MGHGLGLGRAGVWAGQGWDHGLGWTSGWGPSLQPLEPSRGGEMAVGTTQPRLPSLVPLRQPVAMQPVAVQPDQPAVVRSVAAPPLAEATIVQCQSSYSRIPFS